MLLNASFGPSYVPLIYLKIYQETVTDGIQCENGRAVTPQIAVVQVKVKGVLLGLEAQFLVVPGGTKPAPSSQPIPHAEKTIKCHTCSHSTLCAVYIPFLFTTYRYFKPK